jgi:hypothetical protein
MSCVRKLILCGIFWSLGSTPVSAAGSDGTAMVSLTATIDAPLKTVWEALRTERKNDPAHRHIVSDKDGEYIVEEKFENIPVLGAATCIYKEHETPMKKLDYQMISSNKLKAFEGEWELSSTVDGRKTILKLSSHTDAGLQMPFSGRITRDITMKSIKKRIDDIREIISTQQVASATIGVQE